MSFACTALLGALLLTAQAYAQLPGSNMPGASNDPLQQQDPGNPNDSTARTALDQGSALTRQGKFSEAIPLLKQAVVAGVGGYPGGFNLAICYMATGRFREAAGQLHNLQSEGFTTAAVYNLSAQAYLGLAQPQKAWSAMQAAIKLSPKDEKMYAYLLNACTDHYEYELGLRVTDVGLKSLPNSARLHYERAVFLARLDRLEEARPEFAKAAALDPKGNQGYLAQIQAELYDYKLQEAVSTAREAVKSGHNDYLMLSLLGSVLMQAGALPGEPEFQEAREALERSVAQYASYPTAQIALGKLYLMENRPADAITHLEIGRRLEPQNPAVYTSLAEAYRKTGDKGSAERYIQTLGALLKERANTKAKDEVRSK